MLEQWQGSIHWSLTTLDGRILASGEKAAHVEPLGVTSIETLDFFEHLDEDTRRERVFVAELRQGDRCLTRQTAFFVPTKHLSLIDPRIKAVVTLKENLLTIELSACSLARLVEVNLAGADAIFSDNYFDLPAQKIVRVTAPLPAGWNLDGARAALNVRSIYNTYSK